MFLTKRKAINTILTLSLLFTTVLAKVSFAEDHHEGHQEEAEQKGAHGGKLVKQGDYAIEVTVFERGIPPEMRIFVYQQGKLIDPKMVDLNITLSRLGGKQDLLSFESEKDYLVSQQTVVEPHSFEVAIDAKINGKKLNWHYENFEGRTEISDRLLALSEVKTEQVSQQILRFSDTLFGIVSPISANIFNINAPYQGIVKTLTVNIGDKVKKGQLVAVITNSETLQDYNIYSVSNGEVTQQYLNIGDTTKDSAIVQITDLSSVWVDLSAFPKNIEKLSLGLPVSVGDNHGGESAKSTISYIAPMMTGGHIARARAVINNEEGHWRPGMHIKAAIETRQKPVAMAVKVDAMQTFREMPVVFAKFGNTFEVRMLELGESDGEYIEVLGGIAPNTEYVTENSFLMKADVLKDAAKHDH
jgi:cobalt-zinc-cadmium efflux system membrane fusion protein